MWTAGQLPVLLGLVPPPKPITLTQHIHGDMTLKTASITQKAFL